MRNLFITLTSLTAIIFSSAYHNLQAQSRWIGNMPMQYNPSFAGSSGSPRLSGVVGVNRLKFDNSSPPSRIFNFKYKTQTYGFSYDNFISKIRSGIGFTVAYTDGMRSMYSKHYYDTTGSYSESIYRFDAASLRTSLVLSPKISLRGKCSLAPSLELSYKYLYYNFDYTTYPIPNDYFHTINSSYLSLKAGLLFNTPKFYIGYSKFLPLSDNDRMSIFYKESLVQGPYSQVQAGYHFQRKPESRFSMTFQGYLWGDLVKTYYGERKFVVMDYGLALNLRYKRIIWGVGTSGVMAGYQTDKIRITYTQNHFPFNDIYSGELSARITLPQKKKVYWNY